MKALHDIARLALCWSLAACVSLGKYDAAVADAEHARSELSQRRVKERKADAQRAELELALADEQSLHASAELELELATQIAIACGEALDEVTTRNQAGATARAGASGGVEQHGSSPSTGELKIALRSGRMVIMLPADVLFAPGSATIEPQGRRSLREIGSVLASIPGQHFQVGGHTDSDPIRRSAFASNWELSSARALEVVNALIRAGMRPESLSAAGYADLDPVAPNDTAANKAKNRRIEIALQPIIDEIIQVPDDQPDGPAPVEPRFEDPFPAARSGTQHRRTAQAPAAQIGERPIGVAEVILDDAGVER